jgi:hypothetical protein
VSRLFFGLAFPNDSGALESGTMFWRCGWESGAAG